jgi:sporulation protein YlmC with PRC-barrel domain
MRASELIDAAVVGPTGRRLGRVIDVRLAQDGPMVGAHQALRITGLVVGTKQLASRLGYDRTDATGPWLVERVAHWLARGNRFLPWDQVASIEDCVVTARTDELGPVEPL